MFDFCPGDCTEPISAREILEGYGLPDGVVDEALMAHAHELAEQIRMAFDDAFDASQEVMSGVDAMLAADLIDPEVTNA
ncbi:hypothetical protein [Streptomyces sp. NPDC057509]|uniref:hypothetical protein n=1 Tax=Streptomyces sp. NPDC057509 TaxID=3346152 RepID=UPI0036A3F589